MSAIDVSVSENESAGAAVMLVFAVRDK